MLANHLRRKRGVKTDMFLPIFIDYLYGPDTSVNFSHIKQDKIFLSSESLHSKRKDKLKEKIVNKNIFSRDFPSGLVIKTEMSIRNTLPGKM